MNETLPSFWGGEGGKMKMIEVDPVILGVHCAIVKHHSGLTNCLTIISSTFFAFSLYHHHL